MSWTSFFTRVWVAAELRGHPEAERLVAEWGREYQWLRGEAEVAERASALGDWTGQKKALALLPARGREGGACPGTSAYLCCGYRVLHPVRGCPFSCRYCVLRSYLDTGVVTVYLPPEDEPPLPLAGRRWGTGELGDSLALGDCGGILRRLAGRFSRDRRLLLELKTKSDRVDFLLGRPVEPGILPAWSLTTRALQETMEPGTAPPDRRLRAMRAVQDHGYPVGIHFDPLFPGEEEAGGYRDLLDRLEETVRPERVAWISLGVLRFPASRSDWLAEDPFWQGRLAEMVRGRDGKWRYPQPFRIAVLGTLVPRLRKWAPDAIVYLCMESPEVWEASLDVSSERAGQCGRLLDEKAKALRERRLP